MNRLKFNEYLKNPVALSDATIPELKSLVELYPWFQTAQMLYAKALSNSNHVEYYSSLKKTSIVAVDRQMLYKLITHTRITAALNEASFNTVIVPQEKKLPEIKTTEEKVVTKQEEAKSIESEIALDEIKLTSNSSSTSNTSDIKFSNENYVTEFPSVQKPAEEKQKKVELIITPREEVTSKNEIFKPAAEFIPPLYKEGKKELRIAPIDLPEEKNLDEIIVNPVVNAYIEKEFFHVTDINKQAEKETVSIENTAENFDTETGKKILTETLNEPHSFTEWLKLLSGKSQSAASTEIIYESENQKSVEMKQETIHPVKENVKPVVTEEEKKQPEITSKPVDENKLKKQELIDKIITLNPGPTRVTETTEFFTASKNAKVSNKEDETLVTETLAWIYEQQGNYPKAIKAYKTLSLKYPEKSVYFASLIQKIKLKQKQK